MAQAVSKTAASEANGSGSTPDSPTNLKFHYGHLPVMEFPFVV